MARRTGGDLDILQAQIDRGLKEHMLEGGLGAELVDAVMGVGRWDELNAGQRLRALELTVAYRHGKPRESLQIEASTAEPMEEKQRSLVEELYARLTAQEVVVEGRRLDAVPAPARPLPAPGRTGGES